MFLSGYICSFQFVEDGFEQTDQGITIEGKNGLCRFGKFPGNIYVYSDV